MRHMHTDLMRSACLKLTFQQCCKRRKTAQTEENGTGMTFWERPGEEDGHLYVENVCSKCGKEREEKSIEGRVTANHALISIDV